MDQVKTCLVYEIWQDYGSQLWGNELTLFYWLGPQRTKKKKNKKQSKESIQAFMVTLKKYYHSNNRWKIIFTKIIKYGTQILYIFPVFISLVNITLK